jgi:hypothetical protein
VTSEIMRMKFSVANDEIDKIDDIRDKLHRSMQRVGDMFD